MFGSRPSALDVIIAPSTLFGSQSASFGVFFTALTQSVSTKLEEHLTNFEEHAKAEEALMNKGRGAWKVAAWVIGIAQCIGVGVWVDARSELFGVHNSISSLTLTDTNHEARIKHLEVRK